MLGYHSPYGPNNTRADLGLIEETRRAWPPLCARRIDTYPDITRWFLDEPQRNPDVGADWPLR
jgi:hypothetical protein